jgi:hypothetical protein
VKVKGHIRKVLLTQLVAELKKDVREASLPSGLVYKVNGNCLAPIV